MTVELRPCSLCGEMKSEFRPGKRNVCKDCDTAYHRDHYLRNYQRSITECRECGSEMKNGDGKNWRCADCIQRDVETETGWCPKCQCRLPASDFYLDHAAQKRRQICGRCAKAQARSTRLRKVGLTAQDELDGCDRCGRPETEIDSQRGNVKRLAIDHDHSCCQKGCINCVRGLLCHDCNIRLGYIEKIPPETRRSIILGDLAFIDAGPLHKKRAA